MLISLMKSKSFIHPYAYGLLGRLFQLGETGNWLGNGCGKKKSLGRPKLCIVEGFVGSATQRFALYQEQQRNDIM